MIPLTAGSNPAPPAILNFEFDRIVIIKGSNMKCENCEIEHDGSYASGRFCSMKCSRSFSSKNCRLSKNKKISAALAGRNTQKETSIKEKRFSCEYCGKRFLSKKNLGGHISSCASGPYALKRDTEREKKKETLLCLDYDLVPSYLKREKVFIEQQGKCNRCGLHEWLGQKITLELEHKDGNHYNNDRQNIEFLCPNCHSLTHTWRGRNKNKNKSGKRVSDEDLIKAIESTKSIRQALIKVGLAAKGGNYFRVKRLKEIMR